MLYGYAGLSGSISATSAIITSKIGADLALRLLSSAAQGDPAYRAAEHLGRLLRSIFLCDYVTIADGGATR